MLQPYLVARYLFFVLAIDGAHVLKTIPQSMYSPLSLQCACNPSMNAVPTWWHNDMLIKQRKGKHILKSATLHILDLRMNDAGIYRCIFTGPANELHKCAGYNISVVEPTPRSLALHERTAPADAATERSGEVYWHPKMKREDGQHVFKGQPVTLEVFIYSSGSTKPIVRWFGPTDHFDTAPTISEPQRFNCNSPEETQRVLNGTCYRASYTIHRLPAGAEFMCEVKSGALTNASVLQTNFIVFESFKVSEDPHPISERRRPRFEALAMDDIADLILQMLDHNVTEPTEPTKPTFTSTESPSISSSSHPPVLNFASLRPTEIPDLHFFLLSPTACLRGNLTLHCQLPGLASELEVWYLGPKLEDHSNRSSYCLLDGCFDVDPVFIRRSGSTLFKLRSDSGRIREMVHFDETPVSITLADLGTQHSGTYLCKYINHYKLVHVEVKECDDQAIKFNFRQLVVLLICFAAFFILLIVFAVWIRSRRKPVVVELISRTYRAKGFTNKPTRKLNLMCHFHDLYPPDTALQTALGNIDAYNKRCDSVHTAASSAVSNERYRHRKRIFKKPTVSAMYRLSASFSHCAAWEVDASCVLIEHLIAQGNFSSVYHATVHGPLPSHVGQNISDASTHVAVKTVRAAYNVEDLISLFREIQIMVLLNAHPHIIRLMGICTQNGCPRILLEYAVHGNMRDFLRQNRPSDSVSVDDVELPSINSSLDLMSTPDLVKLNPQALLRFGCHVADALTYLESLKLVHRDIAARNVLVTEGYVAKLCDFGLSCPLVDGCYVDEFRERLPFRWMAPESLHDNRFSLKSDVWSFGIYLWELFSLGYTPYPGLSCADIDPWLAAGYRNAQPSMASAEVYRIMLDCWHTEPSLRPSAKSLLDDLKLLVSSTLRSSSRDSGLTSGYRSRQTSGTNPSTSSSVPRPRPVPPVRTVSLPGYTNLPEGYVEMSLEGYLEPRNELRSADLVAA